MRKTLEELEREFNKAREVRDKTNNPSVKKYWRMVARRLERQIIELKRLTR